jgi:hypothetical protein
LASWSVSVVGHRGHVAVLAPGRRSARTHTIALDAWASRLILNLKSAPMDVVMQALSTLGNELIWVWRHWQCCCLWRDWGTAVR